MEGETSEAREVKESLISEPADIYPNHPWQLKNFNIRKKSDVGYKAIHQWARSHKPLPGYCEKCHLPSGYLELSNISGKYLRDLNDYEYLCRSCHALIHNNTVQGEKNGSHKLTEDQVRQIRIRAEAMTHNETHVDIAKDFGITSSMVSMIKNNKRWAWLSNNEPYESQILKMERISIPLTLD